MSSGLAKDEPTDIRNMRSLRESRRIGSRKSAYTSLSNRTFLPVCESVRLGQVEEKLAKCVKSFHRDNKKMSEKRNNLL